MDGKALLDFTTEVAQALFPLLPIDEGKKLVEEILAVDLRGGVHVLSEEELDAFQRRELEAQRRGVVSG